MDAALNLPEVITELALTARAARVAFIVAAAMLASVVQRIAMRRLEARLVRQANERGEGGAETAKRVETIIRLLRQGVAVSIWVVAALVLLAELGMDVTPILAGAGVLGLAVGFGAQNLVRDVISGFFILLENQVRVGDVAVVNGQGGLVEKINFRTIVLRDVSGDVHVFPNGTITTLSNMTKEWSAYVFNIGVAYKEDVDQVMEVMRRTGAALREDQEFASSIIADLEIHGVNELADSAVVIRARFKTRPGKQWEIGREFLRRIKSAFDDEGIEIPFPHRSLYFGEASKPIAVSGDSGKS